MKKNDILEGVKEVSTLVVSAGVGTCILQLIKTNSPSNIGLVTKALCGIGGVVLSKMVAEKATEYTDGKIDDLMTKAEKILTENNEEEVAVG